MMLSALNLILSSKYTVKSARSGETGLLIAEKYDIELIILDLVMKGMSGYDVLATLKSNDKTKDIPVIFITSSEARGDEVRALTSGAVDYIKKPFVADIVTLRVGIHLKLLEQMRTIERFSLTDGLTGVNNRRYFEQQMQKEWVRASRNGTWLSLLMIDIDHFKKFNDTYGHLNGDIALKTMSQVLTSSVQRGSDYVFRWGGEEFAIILPDTPIEGTRLVGEKIRANVQSTPVICGNDSINITVSLGASSIIPTPSNCPNTTTEFIGEVDKALYKAKSLGRNRVITVEEMYTLNKEDTEVAETEFFKSTTSHPTEIEN